MALHRDIYWVGRQWAVTGYGIQACDQKQKGQFDIEAARLWEDGVLESVRALKWLNSRISTRRFPSPANIIRSRRARRRRRSLFRRPNEIVSPPEPPKPVVRKFEMRTNGVRAKFLRVWRIHTRGAGR